MRGSLARIGDRSSPCDWWRAHPERAADHNLLLGGQELLPPAPHMHTCRKLTLLPAAGHLSEIAGLSGVNYFFRSSARGTARRPRRSFEERATLPAHRSRAIGAVRPEAPESKARQSELLHWQCL